MLEKVHAEPGASVSLPVLLLVESGAVTHGDALASASVSAEVVEHGKGPKIKMIHYKNKSGYKRRQGHRQKYTQVRVTGIEKA